MTNKEFIQQIEALGFKDLNNIAGSRYLFPTFGYQPDENNICRAYVQVKDKGEIVVFNSIKRMDSPFACQAVVDSLSNFIPELSKEKEAINEE